MLSILIVNWNTCELLRRCLSSIERFPPTEPYEVIVVDNHSSDSSAEMVRGEFPGVILKEEKTNWGYAKGNNLAFEIGQGDILLTLNPDTEFIDLSLQKSIDILRIHTEDEGIGVLAGQLLNPDRSPQISIRGFPSLSGVIGQATGLDKLLPRSVFGSYSLKNFNYKVSSLAPQPMGTFLMFKRQALETVGDPKHPFDENFPIFFNEVDLLLRLKRTGWNCLYTPEVQLLHHHGASTRQVRKSMIWESHRSLIRYFYKHRTAGQTIFLPLVAAAIYAAAFVRARGYHRGFQP